MSAFDAILNAVQKANQGGTQRESDNFWKAETDKAGNGYAVIRFLPHKDEDGIPFVKSFNHGFKSNTGKWFIEDCPTTIGEDCPVYA